MPKNKKLRKILNIEALLRDYAGLGMQDEDIRHYGIMYGIPAEMMTKQYIKQIRESSFEIEDDAHGKISRGIRGRELMIRQFMKCFAKYYKLKHIYPKIQTSQNDKEFQKQKHTKILGLMLLIFVFIWALLIVILSEPLKTYVYAGGLIILLISLLIEKHLEEKMFLSNLSCHLKEEKEEYFNKFAVCCALVDIKEKEELDELSEGFREEEARWHDFNLVINTFITGIATAGIINQISGLFLKDYSEISQIVILVCVTLITGLLFYKRLGYGIKGVDYNELIEITGFFRFFKKQNDVLERIEKAKEKINE